MTSDLIAQVAEKTGHTVVFEDLVPCGFMKPTRIGFERCQSQVLAAVLQGITTDMEKYKHTVSDVGYQMLLLTAMMICADEDGMVTATDEDLAKFIHVNRQPLARLMESAFISTLPGMLHVMGIGGNQNGN